MSAVLFDGRDKSSRRHQLIYMIAMELCFDVLDCRFVDTTSWHQLNLDGHQPVMKCAKALGLRRDISSTGFT